jgi:hypothetical protein
VRPKDGSNLVIMGCAVLDSAGANYVMNAATGNAKLLWEYTGQGKELSHEVRFAGRVAGIKILVLYLPG